MNIPAGALANEALSDKFPHTIFGLLKSSSFWWLRMQFILNYGSFIRGYSV